MLEGANGGSEAEAGSGCARSTHETAANSAACRSESGLVFPLVNERTVAMSEAVMLGSCFTKASSSRRRTNHPCSSSVVIPIRSARRSSCSGDGSGQTRNAIDKYWLIDTPLELADSSTRTGCGLSGTSSARESATSARVLRASFDDAFRTKALLGLCGAKTPSIQLPIVGAWPRGMDGRVR